MSNLNPLAEYVVKSFNILLREKLLSPDNGKVLAGLMFELATHYRNRELIDSGKAAAVDVVAAKQTEANVRELLAALGLPANID